MKLKQYYKLLVLCILTFGGNLRAHQKAFYPRYEMLTTPQKIIWQKALFYRPLKTQSQTTFKGTADGMNFYLSPKGYYHPGAEFEATLNFFLDSNATSDKKCDYIGRYLTLKKYFKAFVLPNLDCPAFEEFVEGINPQSLSVVFASGYPQNLASYFGHTFLKLNSPKGLPLTDYLLNFAADTGADSGITFALLGVLGWYPGKYSLMPFHLKIKEYDHFEARDLWEYPTSFSQEEIYELLARVWELSHTTWFNYFFFDENCSYQILALLESVRPQLNLIDQSSFYIIPSETIRTLKKNHLLHDPTYIPALKTQYLNKKSITKDQLELAKLHLKAVSHGLSPEESPLYHQLLLKKSRSGEPYSKPTTTTAVPPDAMHLPHQIIVKYSENQDLKLTYVPAFHGKLAYDLPFNPFNHLEILSSTWQLASPIQLNQLTLIDIQTINPLHPLNKTLSYHLNIPLKETNHFLPVVDIGLGGSVSFYDFIFYLAPSAEINLFHPAVQGYAQLLLGYFRNAFKHRYELKSNLKDWKQIIHSSYFISKDFQLYAFYEHQIESKTLKNQVGGGISWHF